MEAQCANLHGKFQVCSPSLWNVFEGTAQNKGGFFERLKLKKKEKGREKIKNPKPWEESLSHLGTLHFGTLSCLAGDLPLLAHAEVTVGAVPHLPVVPDGAAIQAAPFGGHTLLTALPRALHLPLPLKTPASSEQGCLEPLAQQKGQLGSQRWVIFQYLLTGDRATGLPHTSDFSSLAHTCSAGIFFPLLPMLLKKNVDIAVKHSWKTTKFLPETWAA